MRSGTLCDDGVKEEGFWEKCALPEEKTEKETRKQKEGRWDRTRRNFIAGENKGLVHPAGSSNETLGWIQKINTIPLNYFSSKLNKNGQLNYRGSNDEVNDSVSFQEKNATVFKHAGYQQIEKFAFYHGSQNKLCDSLLSFLNNHFNAQGDNENRWLKCLKQSLTSFAC